MARTILIIDDEMDICEACANFLRKKGYDVYVAQDGSYAIEYCQRYPIDIVVTDIIMPHKEGIETIIELHKSFPSIKLFAMSGGGSLDPQNPLNAAKRLGAIDSFAKPFSLDQLASAIEKV